MPEGRLHDRQRCGSREHAAAGVSIVRGDDDGDAVRVPFNLHRHWPLVIAGLLAGVAIPVLLKMVFPSLH